jgi:carboxypeptidase C (cathepsin A)
MGVNLFAESYGGKYAPAFARLWQEQNEKRLNGSIPRSGSLAIKLASVGIINGCVDDLIQGPYYPYMAVNNSYGLTAINPTRAELAKSYFYGEHGCQEAIINCRTAQQQLDPNNVGNNNKVNNLCALAYTTCSQSVMGAYDESNRSPYDIAHMLPDSFPPSTYLEYLNTVGFQEAIGSPINYTESNFQVLGEFVSTGDHEREDLIPEFAALLNAGVRIGFIYGDRDYICNWYGGEAISLAVAKYQDTSPAYNSIFPASGYAPIVVNASEYVGGVVRQFGNLSFSRIYDAGHLVPAYQPETAFQVFARIINGNSVSTGEAVDLRTFNTTGPLVSDHKNKLPDSPPTTCWVRNIPGTCTDEEKMLIVNGTGLIVGGVLYLDPRRYTSMVIDHTTTVSASSPTAVGSVTTVTEVLTGMYTATGVPEGGSSHLRAPFMLGVVVSGLLSLVALW